MFQNSSSARIKKEVEDSLRRLRTDRLDIYQIHWPDPDQLKSAEEAMGWKLSPEDYSEVDRILKEEIRDPVGPEFMAPPARDNR